MLREVLARQLAVVEANEAGLIAGTGPEPLHDLRVAVRRARSALGQLPGVLPARSAARLREELGWLGQLSGPCRDLDVLAETLAALLAASPAWVREELRPLLAALASERAAERRRLLAGLDSPRYRRLLGRWREVAAGPLRGPSPARAQLPAAELLGERAGKAARRLRRHARRLGEHPEPAPLHELRIAAKKLRYLLELFRELGDEAEIRRLGGRLRHLQEELGALNDDAVAARWLAAAVVRFGAEENAAAGGDAAAALRVGLAAGYLLGRLDGRRPSRLGALEPALADLLAIARRRRVARLFAGDASDAGRSG